jgi:excisionase family DNA binding protein
MSQKSTGFSRQEKRVTSLSAQSSDTPLVMKPLEAARQLGVGISTTYKLMKTGELDAFRCGRSRRITVASIHAYIARRIAADSTGWAPITQQPPRRHRGQRGQLLPTAVSPPKRRARTDQELPAE